MRKIITYLFLFIGLSLNAATYYVAPDGDDGAAGTIGEPWETLEYAIAQLVAGDTLFMRAGTYDADPDNDNGSAAMGIYVSNIDGTSDNPICVFNYPGEIPIYNVGTLDCSTYLNTGIYFINCEYWNIKGLRITGLIEPHTGVGSAVKISTSGNFNLENMVIYENIGHGLSISYSTGNMNILNCDAYDNIDLVNNGESADGFQFTANDDSSVIITLTDCRSWYNSDDGIDNFSSDAKVITDGCWSFQNGRGSAGDGNGFKIGPSSYISDNLVQRVYKNCISSHNRRIGFDGNEIDALCVLYNNISFRNSASYSFGGGYPNRAHIIRNNIDYDSTSASGFGGDNIVDHNNWDTEVTVTDADFISTDTLELYRARQSDGSLPDIDFLKLVEGSDLIDAGVDVGITYNGAAPDIGWFESSYEVAASTSRIVRYKGMLLTLDGIIKNQSIPPTPDNGYEYVSPDSVEIILVQNFNWATPQDNPTTAYCVAGMTHGGNIGSVHYDSSHTKHIAFELLSAGDIIMRSDYDSLQCCIEYNDLNWDGYPAPGVYGNTGTGIIWRENLNAGHDPRDTLAASFNVWFEKDFVMGDAMKFNGMYSKYDGDRDSRVMFNMLRDQYGDTDTLQWSFYDWGYDDSEDTEIGSKSTAGRKTGYGVYPDTLWAGEWINVTTIHYTGTTDNDDAFHALFINGVCVNYRTGLMMQNTADGVYRLDQLNIETHMGGSQESYNSPRNQSAWFDDFVVWKYVDGYSGYPNMRSIPDYEQVIKFPIETDYPKTGDPSVLAFMEGSSLIDQNYLAERPVIKDDLWLIPSEVWGDKWKQKP